MKLPEYLKTIPDYNKQQSLVAEKEDRPQREWYNRLTKNVIEGQRIFNAATPAWRHRYHSLFSSWIRTEELKAWYGAPDKDSLFQGTSISSLTIPKITPQALKIESIVQLEEFVADSYIELHDKYEKAVRNAILEDVSNWMKDGLYYGFVLPSKVISQAFGLAVPRNNVVFDVDGVTVDPHEILQCTEDIREKYFNMCMEQVSCFEGLDLSRSELEESLVLADISKPKINVFKDMLLLAPVRCNEICHLISKHVSAIIRTKTNGRIAPPSLMVTIYDSDTPYTYYQIQKSLGNPLAPILPGLVVEGCSGTIDAFRWLYAYRTSLIAQKIQKGSLYSQTHKEFIPCVFFGVLVRRDAEILLDMKNLDRLRYRGNLSPTIEFTYLLPKLDRLLRKAESSDQALELSIRAR